MLLMRRLDNLLNGQILEKVLASLIREMTFITRA